MIRDLAASVAEPLDGDSPMKCLSLVHNEPLERLLFDRNLVGVEFRAVCLEASRLFLAHLRDECSGASELIILSKGLMYQLAEAAKQELGLNLPTNLVATSRRSVSSEDAVIDVAYARFDAGGDTLLIGDTVASGATMVAALREYGTRHAVRRVFILSYAGALVGASRIRDYCQSHGIDVTMLFGLGAFGLASNGFDLSFLHPETIARKEYVERAHRQFDGRAVSSVGWDFGSQAMSPDKYRELCWVEAKAWGLEGSSGLALAQRPSSLDNLRSESGAFRQVAGSEGL